MTAHYQLDGFPPGNLEWERLLSTTIKANAALARYDSLITAVPNAHVLLSPLLIQEASLSSKIEGINVSMSDVLAVEAGAKADQSMRDDVEEVMSYRRALLFAAESLKTRSLSLHLLREIHGLLLQGVRGRDKSPGRFRDRQNWIGRPGSKIDSASYVPVSQEHLHMTLERWEKYVKDSTQPDPLVQAAVMHAEFEAIHPFRDGNGRLGRILIPLLLKQRGVLRNPDFYMSGYLESRRREYVDALNAVSRDGAWTEWCLFFLHGFFEQAQENQRKAKSILNLYREMQHDVAKLTRSKHAPSAVDALFSRPIFSNATFAEDTGIPRQTAHRIIALLRERGIIDAIDGDRARHPAIFVLSKLVDITEGGETLCSNSRP